MKSVLYVIVASLGFVLPRAAFSQIVGSYPTSVFAVDSVSADQSVLSKKVDFALREILEQKYLGGTATGSSIAPIAEFPDSSHILAYVYPSRGSTIAQVVAKLNSLGLYPPVDTLVHVVTAGLPIDQATLLQLASDPRIGAIALVTPPHLNGHGTEGDAIMHGPAARGIAKGDKVTVGVLSDDCGSHAGEPTATDGLATSISIVDDGHAGTRTHEGRAMMDIVHTLAPDAHLAFAQGVSSMKDMASNIRKLAAAPYYCKVICDDITDFAEPFFEDDANVVTQAIHDVVKNNNVVYITSAGNWARDVHTDNFNFSASPVPLLNEDGTTTTNYTVHNFSGSNSNLFYVPAGANYDIVLQWDEPYNGPTDHFKLLLYDMTKKKIINRSQGGGQAIQRIRDVNNGGGTYYGVFIAADGTPPTPPLRFSLVTWSSNRLLPSAQKNGVSSILGHAMDTDVITCSAVSWRRVADGSPDISTHENYQREIYSSEGPSMIHGKDRGKPELVAPDMVQTNVAGWGVFSGTSAAAPHVAAVAAMYLSKGKNFGKTATAVREALIKGCRARGVPHQSSDAAKVGHGLSDALQTLQAP
ncbi:MAG: S8 family serine peptidase [Candidatus Kapaibacterium sp.]